MSRNELKQENRRKLEEIDQKLIEMNQNRRNLIEIRVE